MISTHYSFFCDGYQLKTAYLQHNLQKNTLCVQQASPYPVNMLVCWYNLCVGYDWWATQCLYNHCHGTLRVEWQTDLYWIIHYLVMVECYHLLCAYFSSCSLLGLSYTRMIRSPYLHFFSFSFRCTFFAIITSSFSPFQVSILLWGKLYFFVLFKQIPFCK